MRSSDTTSIICSILKVTHCSNYDNLSLARMKQLLCPSLNLVDVKQGLVLRYQFLRMSFHVLFKLSHVSTTPYWILVEGGGWRRRKVGRAELSALPNKIA